MHRVIIHQNQMHCESLFLFGFVYIVPVRFIFHREYPLTETKCFLSVPFFSFCGHILLAILFILNPISLFFLKE